MNVLKNYLELTKPKVVLMMLITAIVGMLLASKTLPSIYLVIISMIGIGLCASSAATINQIIDRNIDANMARTSNRPLPQGEITTFNASIFALALKVVISPCGSGRLEVLAIFASIFLSIILSLIHI